MDNTSKHNEENEAGRQKRDRKKPAICWLTGKQPDEAPCPFGCEVCLLEECDEYQPVYSS